MEQTKEQFELFRLEFKKAVKELEQKFDVVLKMKAINYDSTGFTTSLNVSKKSSNMPVWFKDDWYEFYNQVKYFYPEYEEFLLKQRNIVLNGKTNNLLFIGMNMSSKKYPYKFVRLDQCDGTNITVGITRAIFEKAFIQSIVKPYEITGPIYNSTRIDYGEFNPLLDVTIVKNNDGIEELCIYDTKTNKIIEKHSPYTSAVLFAQFKNLDPLTGSGLPINKMLK